MMNNEVVNMATLEDQIELERLMVQGGIERYHMNSKRMMDKDLQSETPHGRAIIFNMLMPLSLAIEEMIKVETSTRGSVSGFILKGADPAQLAYLSMVALINTLSTESRKLTAVAAEIAKRIETQLLIDNWVNTDPEVATQILKMSMKKTDLGYNNKRAGVLHKMRKDGCLDPWTTSQRLHVGVRLVEVIKDSLGIIELDRVYNKARSRAHVVILNEETKGWIKKFHDHNEAACPVYKPSLIEPKPFTDLFDGGYHSDYIIRKPIIRGLL